MVDNVKTPSPTISNFTHIAIFTKIIDKFVISGAYSYLLSRLGCIDLTNLPASDTRTSPLRMVGKSSPADELNREIIRFLQEDGRLPFKDIATALEVSEGTIRNRVQSMKEAGVLKIVALADPMAIRYKADAMIGIKVSNLSGPRQVAERLAQHTEIVYVVWVSGRFDLLIEVVCETEEAFRAFLDSHCFGHDDIAQFEIMSSIEMFKNQFLLKRQAI